MALRLDQPATQSGDKTAALEYSGERLRHIAMPIGGIGTGQVALGGDGGLRQWQLFNQINHVGFVPESFFAIRATSIEPPINVIRLLQSRAVSSLPLDPTPLVNDDFIPDAQRELVREFPGTDESTFQATFPFARVAFHDRELPVAVELEAFSPFVPLDAASSSTPAAVFAFTIRNNGPHSIQGVLAGTLQNAVGWDGITPISGNRCHLYGGNTNRARHGSDRTTIVMENPSLPDDHPGAGQMALTVLTKNARVYERWTDWRQFRRFMEGINVSRQFAGQDSEHPRAYRNLPVSPSGPSPAGTTWNGGLMQPFRLAPGESATLTFILSWRFPNRYVNFDQFGRMRDYGLSRFWLGNAYAKRFGDAVDVADQVSRNLPALRAATQAWVDLFRESSLPAWIRETFAAQGSLISSPTCFQTEDGRFYGFEGSLGASTTMWNGDFGGSCPLNCTHVWNYEVALSKLFPSLERTMRETEFDRTQAPAGYLPHRTILPLYIPQLWDEPIGGPTNPALDGMLGAVLKLYREVRQSGDLDWLARYWPLARRLMDYVINKWDGDNDGVLDGEQPNTYDIAFFGPNIYIGALWLAALRATEELARLQGDHDYAKIVRNRFELGTRKYDQLLWNGEYYIQLLDKSAPLHDQFGDGCLADQLFGQWWAHQLDLGYILPEEHVKTTLKSVVKYNFRDSFRGFEHGFRVYADQDDSGLLICTWPRGGRPEIPVRYCDEVWTGIEYQVAAHCINEGMVDEGLKLLTALRARYSGARRNPYNEIECGDHYSRAQAGWSVLEALAGFRYDATRGFLRIVPADPDLGQRLPIVTESGWGLYSRLTEDRIEISCRFGKLQLRELELDLPDGAVRALIGSKELPPPDRDETGRRSIVFAQTVTISEGESLTIEIARR